MAGFTACQPKPLDSLAVVRQVENALQALSKIEPDRKTVKTLSAVFLYCLRMYVECRSQRFCILCF